ncbi:hypothetical protein [Brevibacterium limosum]|nr:hypothetical protein [Brevibacterium limosum]
MSESIVPYERMVSISDDEEKNKQSPVRVPEATREDLAEKPGTDSVGQE